MPLENTRSAAAPRTATSPPVLPPSRRSETDVITAANEAEFRISTRQRLGSEARHVSAALAVEGETATGESLAELDDPVASGHALPARPGQDDPVGVAEYTLARVEVTVVDLWHPDAEEELESSQELADVADALHAGHAPQPEYEVGGRFLVYVHKVVVAPAWRGHRLGHLALVEAVAAVAPDPIAAVALVVGSLDEHGRNNRTARGAADPAAARVGQSWLRLGFGPTNQRGVAFAAPHELLTSAHEELREAFTLQPVYP